MNRKCSKVTQRSYELTGRWLAAGTYDEELLLGSRVLVFALSAEAPSFAAMVLAAHYTGLRPAHTVLLVQPLDAARAPPVRTTLYF